MISAVVEAGDGTFHMHVTGHSDDDATCATVTAIQQTVMIMLEQLVALRPDDIAFTLNILEPTS